MVIPDQAKESGRKAKRLNGKEEGGISTVQTPHRTEASTEGNRAQADKGNRRHRRRTEDPETLGEPVPQTRPDARERRTRWSPQFREGRSSASSRRITSICSEARPGDFSRARRGRVLLPQERSRAARKSHSCITQCRPQAGYADHHAGLARKCSKASASCRDSAETRGLYRRGHRPPASYGDRRNHLGGGTDHL